MLPLPWNAVRHTTIASKNGDLPPTSIRSGKKRSKNKENQHIVQAIMQLSKWWGTLHIQAFIQTMQANCCTHRISPGPLWQHYDGAPIPHKLPHIAWTWPWTVYYTGPVNGHQVSKEATISCFVTPYVDKKHLVKDHFLTVAHLFGTVYL